jgi:hypothetical protein
MELTFEDAEAIAALTFGSLDDYAFNFSMLTIETDTDHYLAVARIEAENIIKRMMK